MANKFKTLPIGTIFTYNGNKYKVCKDDDCYYTCNKCAFNGTNCDTIKDIRGNCIFGHRTDHAQIYYIQINDETMNKDSDNNSIITPTLNTDNSLNDLHIDCPKGYSIDVEHSDLSKCIIKFKNDNITLEDIYENQGKDTFITNVVSNNTHTYNKIYAIAALIDIANYYNKGWKPDWNNGIEFKYYIVFDYFDDIYKTKSKSQTCNNAIYFAHREDAQSVIDNPNFRDILDTIYKD
ncbi:hypothetical protein [Phocaeicola coprophilus]|uniref:hypothetical protein n=1 Tax=Phocaeicola coprophilus TaxID=387090 RepID=UPI003078A07F